MSPITNFDSIPRRIFQETCAIKNKEVIQNLFSQAIYYLLTETYSFLTLGYESVVRNLAIIIKDKFFDKDVTRDLYCDAVHIRKQYDEFLKFDSTSENYQARKELIQQNLKEWRLKINSKFAGAVSNLVFLSYRIYSIIPESFINKNYHDSSLAQLVFVLEGLLTFFDVYNQLPDFIFHFIFNFELVLKAIVLKTIIKSALDMSFAWTISPVTMTLIYGISIASLSQQIIQKVKRLAHDGFFDLSIPRQLENGEWVISSWEMKKLLIEIRSTPQNLVKQINDSISYVKNFYRESYPEIKKDMIFFVNRHRPLYTRILNCLVTK